MEDTEERDQKHGLQKIQMSVSLQGVDNPEKKVYNIVRKREL